MLQILTLTKYRLGDEMALRNKSTFFYGIEIDQTNRSIDFRSTNAGPLFQASLSLGFYSPGDLAIEIVAQLSAADSSNLYTTTVTRTANTAKITINCTSGYLQFLFLTGPRNSSSADTTIGFLHQDYVSLTGSLTAPNTCGFVLVPQMYGYNYNGPETQQNVFGVVSVSAIGQKETITWAIQKYVTVEFRYEPESIVVTDWQALMSWLIQQKSFEFMPDNTNTSVFYDVTLDQSAADGKGLGFKMTEMLPDFPFFYQTGVLKMRVKVN